MKIKLSKILDQEQDSDMGGAELVIIYILFYYWLIIGDELFHRLL